MRARRRPPLVGAQCGLPRRAHPPSELATGAGAASARMDRQLSALKGNTGAAQRTESRAIAAAARITQEAGARLMIQTRRLQRRFADGLIAEEIRDLREPW